MKPQLTRTGIVEKAKGLSHGRTLDSALSKVVLKVAIEPGLGPRSLSDRAAKYAAIERAKDFTLVPWRSVWIATLVH